MGRQLDNASIILEQPFKGKIRSCYTRANFSNMESVMTTPGSEDVISRTFTLEGNAETMERQKKRSEFRGFTILCDEREPMGDNTAPPPLAYFASSLLF